MAATLKRGSKGEDVKRLQRLVGVPDDGVFGPQTEAAVRAYQQSHGLQVDGIVGPKTWAALEAPPPAQAPAPAPSAPAPSSPTPAAASPAPAPKMNDPGTDRAWVKQTFVELLGRNPTPVEMDAWTEVLQNGRGAPGYTRDDIQKSIMRNNADEYTNRMFREQLGRDPRPDELKHWREYLATQQATHSQLLTAVQQTNEGLLRDPNANKQPTAEQEDARAVLAAQLNQYGLGNLSDWAWEQQKLGHSFDRIMVDLRNTPEYKARFPAMDLRRSQGLPPINEAQYVEYESQARDIMRRNGMPPGFWDEPSDYTALLANDISPIELEARVQNGWARVAQAPVEVRDAFASYFGVEGDQALAAWFVDPTKAESMINEATEMARIGGYASFYDLNVNKARAQELFTRGVTSDQAVQAYSRVAQAAPLFTETVTENQDLTAEGEGINAALGLDASSQALLERRGRERVAATSGGGGALISSQGVAAGGAE